MKHEVSNQIQCTINENGLRMLTGLAQSAFGKEFDQMNFDEAARLFTSVLSLYGEGTVTGPDGRIIADSRLDGVQAASGVRRNIAKKYLPRIDDERELILSVIKNKSIWDKIRKRDPKTVQTFSFKNQPPEYA